jgi:aminoglycoside phosphotransferase (APT) family kinase protein
MEFTRARLTDYLAAKLGAAIELEDVVQLGRGSSRETWVVSLRQDGHARRLVFRLDFPTGSIIPSRLEDEYFLYDRLGLTDVPIARALWWEDDRKWTGRPFYVREHVDGSWNVPGFLDPSPEFDALRIAISKEHLECLAKVHGVDWKGLGLNAILPAPPSVGRCADTFIDTIVEQYEATRGEAVLIVLEAAELLRDNAPVAPRICLCKGTNGLGEEVLRDGRIVAMSDWEEASIGDPAADFAFLQNFIPEIERDGERLWGQAEALAYYREVSGIAIDPAAIRYYGTLRALKAAVFGQKTAKMVHDAPALAEVRHSWNSTEVAWFGKRIVGAALGWMEPPPPRMIEALNASVEQSS